ncbi:DUF2905 domain-containing protein [Candidatus Methylocalor cossyra]|uniref:Uncharacterized membrane protein YrzS n=1 Tax=Candidatus Methylocalor cossyra TaxID=3108543 RepID=A0ABM9NF49_9GAMM
MTTGKMFILLGVGLIILGLVLDHAPGLFGWFGKLPGDIRIQDEHRSVFIPITSMIVLSVLLTLLINLFFRR